MPRRSAIVRKLRDVDDVCNLLTGKRLSTIVGRGISLFGDEVVNAIAGKPAPEVIAPNDPYVILGVRKDAGDLVIKAVYRSLAKQTHPDTGAVQQEAAFQKYTEAFNRIMAERHGSPSES